MFLSIYLSTVLFLSCSSEAAGWSQVFVDLFAEAWEGNHGVAKQKRDSLGPIVA